MSFELTKMVLHTRIESTAVKLTALVLADAHNKRTGRLFASMDYIATHAGITPSQARRNVHQLIALEVLEVVGNAQGGRGLARDYRFNVPVLKELAIDRQHEKNRTDATLSADERIASTPPIRSNRRVKRVAPTPRKGGIDAAKDLHECQSNKVLTRNQQGSSSADADAGASPSADGEAAAAPPFSKATLLVDSAGAVSTLCTRLGEFDLEITKASGKTYGPWERVRVRMTHKSGLLRAGAFSFIWTEKLGRMTHDGGFCRLAKSAVGRALLHDAERTVAACVQQAKQHRPRAS